MEADNTVYGMSSVSAAEMKEDIDFNYYKQLHIVHDGKTFRY